MSNINFLDCCIQNSCNYRCRACISNSIRAYYQVINGEKIYFNSGWTLKPLPFLKYVTNHFHPEDTVIQLSGGEPLLYEALPMLIKDLTGMKYRVGVNTNGFMLKTFFRDFPILHAPEIDHEPFVVKWRVSWHPRERSFELFCKDIEPLYRIPKSVLINYVVTPQHIENGYVNEHIEALEKLTERTGIRHERTPMQGQYNGNDYNKFDPIYDKYLTEPGPVYKVNYFSVLANGQVHKCHRIPLGNIYENTLSARNFDGDPACSTKNGRSACGAISAYGILGIL